MPRPYTGMSAPWPCPAPHTFRIDVVELIATRLRIAWGRQRGPCLGPQPAIADATEDHANERHDPAHPEWRQRLATHDKRRPRPACGVHRSIGDWKTPQAHQGQAQAEGHRCASLGGPSIGEAGWAGPPLARGGVGRWGRVKRGFVFPIRPMGRLASSFTGNI
jgi:hypothetical protein